MSNPISIRINDELLKKIDKETQKCGKTRTQYILDKIDSDNRNFDSATQKLIKIIAVLGNIISNNNYEKDQVLFRYKVLENLNRISELLNKIYTEGEK